MEPERLKSPGSSGTPGKARNRILTAGLCLLILILGALLRFDGITSKGPRYYDTGAYVLEARWIVSSLRNIRESLRAKADEMRSGEDDWQFDEQMRRIRSNTEGLEPRYARPGHPTLIAPAIWLVGDTPWIGALVSAVTGTLTLLVVFALGSRLYGPRVGLMAALLLAVSGYHVLYSTEAWADMNAASAATVALYFYVRSRESLADRPYRHIMLCGLLCGAAFTVHDRSIIALIVFWVLELVLDLRSGAVPKGLRLRRLVLLTSCFAVVLIAFETPYYLTLIFLRRWGEALPFPTYFEELLHHTAVGLGRLVVGTTGLGLEEFGSPYANFLTYPYLFWLFNGPVLTLCLIAGCVAAFRARRRSDRILLAWFFLPLVFFSLQLGTVARMGLIAVPAAALLAGRAFERLPGEGSNSGPSPTLRLVMMGIVAAVLIQGTHPSRNLVSTPCGYEEAFAFLHARERARHISTQMPISQVYVGVRNVAEPPASREEMDRLVGEGYRYYLVDVHKHALRRPGQKLTPE